MSQHDMSITQSDANTGVTFRAEVNAALQALASLSCGPNPPSVPYANQLWLNTNSPVHLYRRNPANTAWVLFDAETVGGVALSGLLQTADGTAIYAAIAAAAAASVPVTTYTAADILAKLLTVDADNSGLNASTLRGMAPVNVQAASSIPMSKSSGNGGKLDSTWLETQCLLGAARGLAIGTISTTQVAITASEVVLQTISGGISRNWSGVNVQADITHVGSAGIESTGEEAANTWYFIWLIGKADGTISALLSLVATPTGLAMPSGYNYAACVGAVRNNASSDFIGFQQRGKVVNYTEKVTIKDGTFSINAWTSIDPTAFFPSTANFRKVMFGVSGGTVLGLASNSNGFGGEVTRIGTNNSYDGSAVDPGLGFTARIHYAPLSSMVTDGQLYYRTDNANASMYAWGWDY